MGTRTSRRTFIRHIGAAGAAMPLIMPPLVRAKSHNSKLNVAFIGTGGRGSRHVGQMASFGENCPCYCDVDTKRQSKAAKNWPKAKGYQDYRAMLEKEHQQIDAVFVATPDHHHFPAAMMALQLDKHVYCEKPLTWGIWEARRLTEEYEKRKDKVATQMGNQGHAGRGWRIVLGWIEQGVIGDIIETHTWTNRPVWPQGIDRPKGSDPVPDSLDWDTWIGPAPKRPFKKNTYHPFKWRGWFDFGAGALGDMACHTMDGVFWAFNPGHPESVEMAGGTPHNNDSFPSSTVVKWSFPERDGRPAFNAYWYDGGMLPPRPEALEADRDLPKTGNIYIGTKGSMMIAGSYGNSPRIIPESHMREVGKPNEMMDPSPGHHKEFVLAAKGEKPPDFPKSNFSYAGPMTETIQLGNLAVRTRRRLEWDGPNMKVTNYDPANEHVRREPRSGWKVV